MQRWKPLANFDLLKNGNYGTQVNGIKFEFLRPHSVEPTHSILAAQGADWVNLSTATYSRLEFIGLRSVVRNDDSSNEKGYSMDVGSIRKIGNKENITIRYDHDHFKENKLPISDKDKRFLEIVRSQSSIRYNLNPYYMVYSSGEVIPNFFTFAPKELWKTDFTKLDKGDQEIVATRMIEAARDHEPDSYTLTRDMAKRMWDHLNHLHNSETGY